MMLSGTALAIVLAAIGLADEPDQSGIAIEYPGTNAIYSSNWDFVVTGTRKRYDGPIVVELRNSTDVVMQNVLSKPDGADPEGRWVCQISVSRLSRLKPGEYKIRASPVQRRRIEVPIKIAADRTQSNIPCPLPSTAVGSDDYRKLPIVKLPESLLVGDEFKPDEAAPDQDERVRLETYSEFSVEGSLRLDRARETAPDVVLRLTRRFADKQLNDKHSHVTLCETLVRCKSTDDKCQFGYRAVMRIPDHVGELTLEALCGGQVITSSRLEVHRRNVPVADRKVVIEHPQPDCVYLSSSEVVVSGTSSLYLEPLTVALNSNDNVLKPIGAVRTGGELTGGAWKIRLQGRFVEEFRSGVCQLFVCPLHAPPQSLQIRFISDPENPTNVAKNETKVGSEQYDALQHLRLERSVSPVADGVIANAIALEANKTSLFKTLAGREFAAEGGLVPDKEQRNGPANVILRLRGLFTDSNGEAVIATVYETVVSSDDPTDGGDQVPFRAVLRAASFPGKFAVEAMYRGSPVASSSITVKPTRR